ncbi:MAG: GNAT family N-acetyltransferase, partial [Desulfovibrio sp.]|nr:GNAT family N-acetyltransferase [Desulfovibrio sp.]
REYGASDCWAVAPRLPASLAPYRTESDAYYLLDADSPVPGRLRNCVRKASERLRIEEGREFTAAHRKLWAEFLRGRALKPQARELFARIPFALGAPGSDIRLLNARNADGGLAACLVLDFAPANFCTYLIGARAGTACVPHAGDALFAVMLEKAREEGKKFLHLGLGVNDGIRRFKKKWGGAPEIPYEAASFPAGAIRDAGGAGFRNRKSALRDVVFSSLLQPREEGEGMSLFGKRLPPEQRPYAMLWELRKNGKTSWIGGTAHAFCYSFASALQKLFSGVDAVIFEGPLDAASLAAFDRHGKTRDASTPRLLDLLKEEDILRLERVVQGPRGKIASLLNTAAPNPADVREILARHRPWSVFFTLYYAFLERHGWKQSVDLEAWEIARGMGKHVVGMESVDEQIASLESVPLDRILRFLKNPEDWTRRMKQSRAAYLDGDLKRLLDTGTEFPTRTGAVIGARDQRFRERMLPWIEQGRAAVFVGTAHMLNLENMLREDGFEVVRTIPTWRRKLLARLRRRFHPGAP